jgi:hypothetical protein
MATRLDVSLITGPPGGLAASVSLYIAGRLRIYLPADLAKDWRNFVVAKSVANVLLHLTGNPTPGAARVLGAAAASTRETLPAAPSEARRWVMQQAFEELVALHLLAGEMSDATLRSMSKGDVSIALGLPEELIARARTLPRELNQLSKETAQALRTMLDEPASVHSLAS